MSEVLILDSDEWELPRDKIDQLDARVQFAGSPIVFNLQAYFASYGCGYKLKAKPRSSIDQESYRIECHVRLFDGQEYSGVVSQTTTLLCELIEGPDDIESVIFTFKKITPFYTRNANMEAFIERGPSVTLVGSDGSVSVPKRLLEMWSEALEAMFNHDSLEKRTGQIRMEDYNAKTLTAFKQFLLTGKIENGNETALGLILLADKYDVQVMKKAAEDYVKQNFQEMDKDEVLDILQKVSRNTLFNAMIDSWSHTK